MGIVRNFIDIVGITPEDELPDDKNGNTIVFSEVENLFLPEEKEKIGTIFQIIVNLKINSQRRINTKSSKIGILDGTKEYKIMYSGKETEVMNIVNINMPFNAFFDSSVSENINAKVFIVDAYFELIDSRRIYGHFIYMIKLNNNNCEINLREISDLNLKSINSRNYAYDEVSISNEDKINTNIINFEKAKNQETDNDIFDIDSEYL